MHIESLTNKVCSPFRPAPGAQKQTIIGSVKELQTSFNY